MTFALEPAREADPVRIAAPAVRLVGDRDGLPQNTVKAIAFDRDGFLWVGTQDGAAVSDGRTWTTVDMPSRAISNWINTIAATPDGTLYFGTNGGGVCRLVGDTWTVFAPPAAPLHDGFIYQIGAARDGGVWVAGGQGLYRLQGDSWTECDAPAGMVSGDVSSFVETTAADGTSELWISSEGGIARRRDGRWEHFDRTSGLPSTLVYMLTAGRDERGGRVVWAGTDGGLAVYRDEAWSVVTEPSGPGSTSVYSVLVTSSDTLCAGTQNGLYRRERGVWRATTRRADSATTPS
jgi:ligand-binding sensor domain-containing protein